MRFSFVLIPLLIASAAVTHGGTARQADGIRRAYEADFKQWALKLQIATRPEDRAKIAAERPDADAAARRMWSAIRPNLAEPWTLEPAAWLLRLGAGSAVEVGGDGAFPAEAATAIREAVVKHHLASEGLAPLCMAVVATNHPGSLPLLERIEKESPHKKTQGVAALAIAMMLKDLSDEPEVMRRRLTLLRKAIIESSEVEIQGVSVATLAADELYVIRFLSKGREAPDLVGSGSGGEPIKLSDFRGKVAVLLFWRSEDGSAEQLCQMVKGIRERFAGKPFEIVGVHRDSIASLRGLQRSGDVEWPNFSDPENKLGNEFRIASWPAAYVLDGERRIHYAGPMGSFVELTASALLQER